MRPGWLSLSLSLSGQFVADASFTLHEDIRYAILFDPAALTGSLYSYPDLYPTRAHQGNFFWNRHYDNKLYMQVTVPSEGTFGYSMNLVAFAAANSTDAMAKGRALLQAQA
jgi:hypothetical protein